MKELGGEGSATTTAAPERSVTFLGDIDGYRHWYPDVVRSVEVLERDDAQRPVRARVTLRAAVGPINRDLSLELAITHGTDAVTLARIPHQPSDPERFEVRWRVRSESGGGSALHVRLEANIDVPRFVPLGGVGDSLASGFAEAAARGLNG